MPAHAARTDAFIRLLTGHERLVHKVCAVYAQDAEDRKDLFQEIVLQAWKAFPRFNGRAKETTWLYRIALNTAISRQRAGQRQPDVAHSEGALLQLACAPPEGEAAFRMLRQIIGQLPDLERAIVLLHLEERSHAEIADIMGLSVSNVGTKLGRIREKLKKLAAAVEL